MRCNQCGNEMYETKDENGRSILNCNKCQRGYWKDEYRELQQQFMPNQGQQFNQQIPFDNNNFTQCKTCGNMIGVIADICPRCGTKQIKKKAGNAFINAISIILIFISLFANMIYIEEKNSANPFSFLILLSLLTIYTIWYRKAKKNPRLDSSSLKKSLIAIFVMFILTCISNSFIGIDENELTQSNEEVNFDDYSKECQEIESYKELFRNVENYKGTKIKVTGNVNQVVSKTRYLVAITKDEFGFWDDNVYVEIDSSDLTTKILEDDIIEIYGEVSGTYDYLSVLGQSIEVPKISAKFIELSEEQQETESE